MQQLRLAMLIFHLLVRAQQVSANLIEFSAAD
jgi:hypothetical protein